MSKRHREIDRSEQVGGHSGTVGSADVDDDYVAYASEGSDAAQVVASISSDDMSEEDGITLEPDAELVGSDGDAISDVEVTFEFFDPVPTDARILVRLLTDFASESGLNASDFAEAVVKQTSVGTCVKITDEPDPVAFITCLNVRRHQALLQGLMDKIVAVSGTSEKGSVAEMVRKASDDGDNPSWRMGLVVTERVVNLPPVLVAKMQEALFSEIEWATEDEKDPALRESFRIRRYLYVTEAYCHHEVKSHPAGKRRRKEGWNRDEMVFPRAEDEAWMEVADDAVSWPIEGEKPGAQGLTRMRMAMVVHSSKIPTLRDRTTMLVGLEESKDQESGSQAQSLNGAGC